MMQGQKTGFDPRVLLPMLSASADPFDDPAFIFETKWDGIRCIAAVNDRRITLWGRNAADSSGRYPELDVLLDLPDGTMVDGELVMVRDGRADFHALMARHRRRPRKTPFFVQSVKYVVF